MSSQASKKVECPVCSWQVTHWEERPNGQDTNWYDCSNCGNFAISRTALKSLERLDDKAHAVLAFGIRQQQSKDRRFLVNSTHLTVAERGALPDPAEQFDRLILAYGLHQASPGESVRPNPAELRAAIGAMNVSDVTYIFDCACAEDKKFIEKRGAPGACGGRLTLQGWRRFHEIQRGFIHSRTAFMAMPFGNTEVTRLVNGFFRPAVEKTGFLLKRLDDEPTAGSIDDRLRVEIRMCRFLIADLTCENRGVYWEAGYAEGLGKPVIYTCNKFYFEKEGTHFDTNHRQTILWDLADPGKARRDLMATIRATLPFEAKMLEES